jgi:DNA-binding HxlR family transcriptional regulator
MKYQGLSFAVSLNSTPRFRRKGRAMKYGQFCPIAKSLEILGEKWTLLIIRELLMGSTRFGELQRGLGTMSPALLTKRLRNMETHNLIVRRKNPGERGYAYYPTDQTKELMPILEAFGVWGLRWMKSNLVDEDYDVELLMLYLERSIVPENLVGEEIVIHFHFTDLSVHPQWWIVVKGDHIEVCVKDPGKDVDIYFTTKVSIMTDAWLGHRSYRNVIENGDLSLIGPPHLTNTVAKWMTICGFAELPGARTMVA